MAKPIKENVTKLPSAQCGRMMYGESTLADDNPNDPKELAERFIDWFDATLDAATWFSLSNVALNDAARLLCQLNPDDAAVGPLVTSNDETGPDHFKRLLRVFADEANADAQTRTLLQWRNIARDRNLTCHSWIDEYQKAKTLLDAGVASLREMTEKDSTEWKEAARVIALEYLDRHRKQELFPSQTDVCEHVEKTMRQTKIYSQHGKPVGAGYIRRNAVGGDWWQKNKC
jgi:hypothetical protein